MLQIYNTELEKEYNNFQDWLYIFPLYRGKANDDEYEDNCEDRIMGKCKVSSTAFCHRILPVFVRSSFNTHETGVLLPGDKSRECDRKYLARFQ